MMSRTSPRKTRLASALLLGLALGLSTSATLADPPRAGHAPDPPARASAKQWVFDITVRAGKMTVDQVREVTIPRPATTPRMMGRYALELYVGKELLDRARFNVPLTGDGSLDKADKPRRPSARPTFENVSTRLRVQMADNSRATYAALVDRATGSVVQFEWPPTADGRLVLKTSAPPAPSPAQGAGAPAKDAALAKSAEAVAPVTAKEPAPAQNPEPAKSAAPANPAKGTTAAPKSTAPAASAPRVAKEAPKPKAPVPAQAGGGRAP